MSRPWVREYACGCREALDGPDQRTGFNDACPKHGARVLVVGYLTSEERAQDMEAALSDLVGAMDRCGPHIGGAFAFGHIHGERYTGPTYDRDLAAARSALASEPTP